MKISLCLPWRSSQAKLKSGWTGEALRFRIRSTSTLWRLVKTPPRNQVIWVGELTPVWNTIRLTKMLSSYSNTCRAQSKKATSRLGVNFREPPIKALATQLIQLPQPSMLWREVPPATSSRSRGASNSTTLALKSLKRREACSNIALSPSLTKTAIVHLISNRCFLSNHIPSMTSPILATILRSWPTMPTRT